jgi:hypothetical protein
MRKEDKARDDPEDTGAVEIVSIGSRVGAASTCSNSRAFFD